MADVPGSGSNGRPSPYGGNVPRRLSYASVASGVTAQDIAHPARAGAFSHLVGTTPSSSYPPQYQPDPQYRRRQSGLEHDPSGVSYWRKPTSLPSYSRKFADISALGTSAMPSNPFIIPSYLRRSRYASNLEAAHKAKMKREREQPLGGASSMNSLSSGAGHTNIQRIAPSHRGMTYDIIESNPPSEDDQPMPLPSRWSEQDKYPGLDLSNDGRDVKYSGTCSKADIEAASVRADYPMSPACGIYYFEVEIKNKTRDTAIAIGFSTAEASLERLPGWETHSWGYHGDDGKMFFGEHQGRSYGPTFGAGDVIGCGVNFNAGHAFFTRNGHDLGICFRDLRKDFTPFPTVGMKKHSGAWVSTNFGERPFVFDIDGKMLSEQARVMKDINTSKVSALRLGRDENTLVQELVAQFLAHDGYVETAKAFAEDLRREKEALSDALPTGTSNLLEGDDTESVYRQKIRRAILDGDIDEALEITHARFPTVLTENPGIVFRLKCRKWVELIGKTTELNAKKSFSGQDVKSTNGSGKAVADDADFSQEMELDENAGGGTQTNGLEKPLGDDTALRYNQLLNEAMQYGQELQREYRDDDGEYARSLQDIFSLMAYDDPKGSIHGHLLDPSGRVDVAEELNSAILVSLGRSPAAAVETTWKQTEALIDVLAQDGGPAAFVNLQAMFST
ncbi:Ran-binding protein 9 [Exophiala dermatitidis]|uniref:Protein FYV10 n=1 Tax=Exophiala dermatitidis (strain ATCC 34100 / CBS 525.76 / NIH/UT8656) TaxID=858893 RepID=H6C0M5_EXODN|nr:uncharacterized protein HMPREF1120_05311 [Exophiala dermatitidis NIH/UT8656]EHY57267.1 hypothetical protein HMPREF1120_05311 [Exophiala dermatitidis NIH/UT8656]